MRINLTGGMLTAFVFCSLAFGQISNLEIDKPIGEQLLIPQPPVQKTIRALEGPINPDTYLLGPGDGLEFSVWGGIELSYELEVSPDGTIGISGIGEVNVADMTLSEAQAKLEQHSKKAYPRSTVSLRLIQIRMMKASISGVVEYPGVYELTSVDRLSALILSASGFMEVEDEEQVISQIERKAVEAEERKKKAWGIGSPEQSIPQPSLRKIKITNVDGEDRLIDYLRFMRTGNLTFNPVIRDGDQVNVPAVDGAYGVLHIFGAVKSPGEYEFLEGDNIKSLIELAGGARSDAQLTDVRLVRFEKQSGSFTERRVNITKANGQGVDEQLHPDDRVFVRKRLDYRPKHYVSVKGEVNFPGIYPIEEGVSRLSEIIQSCGGFTDYANLSGANILRWSLTEVPDPEFERLQVIPVADMSEMEYEYFKARAREDVPKVTVDFYRLFRENDDSQDIPLSDKDEIDIPTISPTVRVTGNVIKPGLVKFIPNANYDYYIQEVGGYTYNAHIKKRRLIKAHTGVWVNLKKDTPVEIGDTIFIPEKAEIDYWELYKDILLVISQLATVFFVVQSIR